MGIQVCAVALLMGATSACSVRQQPTLHVQSSCLLPEQTPQKQIMLYFGLARPDGGIVSNRQWQDFVAGSVTPRFPDGLTEIDAQGQWRDRISNKIGREPSRILLLVTPATPDLALRIQAVRTLYRTRFGQQSVGAVSHDVCASF